MPFPRVFPTTEQGAGSFCAVAESRLQTEAELVATWLQRAALGSPLACHDQDENQPHCPFLGALYLCRYFCQEIAPLSFCSVSNIFNTKKKGHLPSSFPFGLLCFPHLFLPSPSTKPRTAWHGILESPWFPMQPSRAAILLCTSFSASTRQRVGADGEQPSPAPPWALAHWQQHCNYRMPKTIALGCHAARRHQTSACGKASSKLLSQNHRNGHSMRSLQIFTIVSHEAEQGWEKVEQAASFFPTS